MQEYKTTVKYPYVRAKIRLWLDEVEPTARRSPPLRQNSGISVKFPSQFNKYQRLPPVVAVD